MAEIDARARVCVHGQAKKAAEIDAKHDISGKATAAKEKAVRAPARLRITVVILASLIFGEKRVMKLETFRSETLSCQALTY